MKLLSLLVFYDLLNHIEHLFYSVLIKPSAISLKITQDNNNIN